MVEKTAKAKTAKQRLEEITSNKNKYHINDIVLGCQNVHLLTGSESITKINLYPDGLEATTLDGINKSKKNMLYIASLNIMIDYE